MDGCRSSAAIFSSGAPHFQEFIKTFSRRYVNFAKLHRNKSSVALHHPELSSVRDSLRDLPGISEGYTSMLLTNLVRLYRRWRRYDASLRELSRLGDRELADIGISRSEITHIAWQHARS